jgi:two-component system, chemotaxis family, protein-glutamate methylesterase/glutaminase
VDAEVNERFPVVALVSSTGGLDALSQVLTPLPPSFPAAVIALQHTSPAAPGVLAEILARRTALPVRFADDGDPLVPGQVLVIPPAAHMLVGADARVRLIKTGSLPPARPSADLLLSTLAVALGSRAVAVVLTGGGTDASLGTQAIHVYGGQVMVQDEASSKVYGMPGASVHADHPGQPVPLDQIADALLALLTP